MISHALNKLQLIQQGSDEPIVNYNQRYQNLVERLEGCQLNDVKSTVAMELYLGSVIEPIRKSIHNTLYFNSKHTPKHCERQCRRHRTSTLSICMQ